MRLLGWRRFETPDGPHPLGAGFKPAPTKWRAPPRDDGRRVLRSFFLALLTLLFVSPALAQKGKLRERLTPEVMAVVYPAGAERLGPEEGSPAAIAVYEGDKPVAYLFSTLDIVAAPGYSAVPFDVIAGVDLDGRITGAQVVF